MSLTNTGAPGSGTENQDSTGAEGTLKTNLPDEGSPKPTLDDQKNKLTLTAFDKGRKVGRNDLLKEYKSKLAKLGIDLDDLDNEIARLESISDGQKTEPDDKSGKGTQGKPDKGLIAILQNDLKGKSETIKKLETEKEIIRKEERLKYQIRSEAGKLNPYDIEETTKVFYEKYEFDEGKDGLIIRERLTENPVMDDGRFLNVEEAFKAWSQKNLWRFKSFSQGGAGISSGGGGIEGLDMARIRNKDITYIKANYDKIVKSGILIEK